HGTKKLNTMKKLFLILGFISATLAVLIAVTPLSKLAPNDKIDIISSILPGMNSPTILPLAKEGWSSLHSVINKNEFWEVIDELKQNGAEGILVCPIENMVL
ncbi:MAG: hypothetical protein HRU26_11865, partial [Psychroserpens sp.]|nr:hypothetical protein [Psychroserpens sp.]